jgi:hypothetical protein
MIGVNECSQQARSQKTYSFKDEGYIYFLSAACGAINLAPQAF